MKVKHYNEMMAYLTRPGFNGGGSVRNKTVLPKRKPAAEVKKRKKINYDKIKQYLGEESREFIERELGFAIGGRVNPAQLKQRFMELVASIQDADETEIPGIVAQAKQIKDQIDEINLTLAPERQIKITSQGLDFDNPLIDAAKIEKAVMPVSDVTGNSMKDVVPESLTTENPALKGVVPDFPRGTKGTGADPEEKEDIFEREPGERIATNPNRQFTKASMKGRRTDKTIRDYLKNLNLFKKVDPTTTEGSFAEGGDVDTPKRGLVDEPGSYAGKPVIKDTKYGVNIKYDTRVKKYFKRTQEGKVYQDSEETLKQFLEKNTRQEIKRTAAQKKKIIKAYPEIKLKDFDKNPTFGVNRQSNDTLYRAVQRFVNNDFKIPGKYKDVVLSAANQKRIQENFELPAGQEKWNFRTQSNPRGFKYGFPLSADGRNDSLAKRIDRFLGKKDKITLAADRYTAKGWMMGAMERLYKQEKKSGVKVKDLTYQPKFNKEGVITGFTDNTASGNSKTYYGLEKNERADATSWRVHGDFRKINKFLEIANGVKADPDRVLQKILDDKGLSKLGGSKRVGEKFTLTLNDILSHQRYYDVLSKTSPKALIERQIVLHHTRGIGAGSDIARAAATKDIQLLTGAVNANVEKIENIVKGTPKTKGRKLLPDEVQQLKNYEAKIVDFDGRVVGGGSVDPTTQFKSIQKDALKYARSDQFNVKTVNNYLARIGCPGKGSGGRIGFFEGGNLSKCAERGIKKLQTTDPKNLSPADKINVKNIGKVAQGARLLKNIFGPAAIAGEFGFEGLSIANKAIGTGMPLKTAYAESPINKYLAGEKTKVDLQAELAKEFAKGEDFAMAERGRRKAPFLAQGEYADRLRREARIAEMQQKFPGTSEEDLTKRVKALYPDIDLSMFPMQELKQQVDDAAKMDYFADNFRQEKAGGGIAKQAGVESGPAPESGPTPDGPKGLFSALKYVKKS
jgi:hypothetical protein